VYQHNLSETQYLLIILKVNILQFIADLYLVVHIPE